MNDYGFTYGEDTGEWRKSDRRFLAIVWYAPRTEDFEWRIYFDYGGQFETLIVSGWARDLADALLQANDFLAIDEDV